MEPVQATHSAIVPGSVVTVLGLGRSGIAAASLILARQARPRLVDDDPHALASPGSMRLISQGALPPGANPLQDASLLVVSPGIHSHHPLLVQAKQDRIPIWSELELAFRHCKARVLAVTGSDGKSTTCSLLAHMLQTAGLPTVLGGNIGTPFSDVVEQTDPDGFAVIEVSSYQLEHTGFFSPCVASILNLAQDHLARHGTMETYAQTKAKIFSLQRPGSWRVVNADQPELRRLVPYGEDRLLRFSIRQPLEAGAYIDKDWMVCRKPGRAPTRVLSVFSFPLAGRHNWANALAALAMLLPLEIDGVRLAEGLRSFRGLPHRLEVLGAAHDITFVNDSKATNTHAASRALESFSQPIILLLGGKDKGLPFSPLFPLIQAKARMVIVFGEAGDRLAKELHGAAELHRAVDIEQALLIATHKAQPGEVVLLSPACSSFDAYSSFEDRGDHFRHLVSNLEGFVPQQNIPPNAPS